MGKAIIAGVWAKASETVTLRFQTVNSVEGVETYFDFSVGTTPTLLTIIAAAKSFNNGESHYFDLITQGASEVMFWSDGLYFVTPSTVGELITRDFDDGTAEIELAASYRQPALEIIQAIAESEPRSFFFVYCDHINYLEHFRFWDLDHRAVASSATFSDDGSDVPYQDLFYAEHAIDRISECELTSQGDFEDENTSATIWELSPTPVIIPATETMVFHAFYSQPSRDCTLSVNPDGTPTSYPIAIAADDGFIQRYEDGAHPPDLNDRVLTGLCIGQALVGTIYYSHRGYLRFNTAPIADDATITAAKLRLKLTGNHTDTDFAIQVRDCAWGDTLAVGDWSGVGTVRGTYADTADLPPVGEWIEIDIAIAGVVLDGYTEFELMSDNEAVPPTGHEHLYFAALEQGDPPLLIVTLEGAQPDSEVFENYGVGAKITIGAGADPALVEELSVTGYPLRGSMEESKVVDASASPPAVERTLRCALPLQGTRTASMVTEADRLADFYDGRIWRCSMVLRPKNDTVLTQMLAREIGDKIHVENVAMAFSTDIDGDMWIEGIEHHIQPGIFHETIFHLEQA